jgi:hypothetical protein
LKEFQKLTWPSRWINILLTVSVLAYLYSLPRVGDAVAYPETSEENLASILLWIGTHFAIGWASATHAWNGLIDTTGRAVKQLGWDEDRKTEHQERLESFMGMIWGTRLTFLIASAILAVPLALSVLNLLTEGYLIESTTVGNRGLLLFAISPALFGFASWIFLTSRLAEYDLKVRPVIEKAQFEETGRREKK